LSDGNARVPSVSTRTRQNGAQDFGSMQDNGPSLRRP